MGQGKKDRIADCRVRGRGWSEPYGCGIGIPFTWMIPLLAGSGDGGRTLTKENE